MSTNNKSRLKKKFSNKIILSVCAGVLVVVLILGWLISSVKAKQEEKWTPNIETKIFNRTVKIIESDKNRCRYSDRVCWTSNSGASETVIALAQSLAQKSYTIKLLNCSAGPQGIRTCLLDAERNNNFVVVSVTENTQEEDAEHVRSTIEVDREPKQ